MRESSCPKHCKITHRGTYLSQLFYFGLQLRLFRRALVNFFYDELVGVLQSLDQILALFAEDFQCLLLALLDLPQSLSDVHDVRSLSGNVRLLRSARPMGLLSFPFDTRRLLEEATLT